MKLGRPATGALLVLIAAAGGCGRKPRVHASHARAEAPPAPAPTPDTTPIEVLRTPAGLVLKVEEPNATPRVPVTTPAPTPASGAKAK
ncbi:MAG: hypothetical protein ABI592_14475 [Acidobacteriota bacterium]